MKRIVIIEGSVRGIAAESPSQDVLTIDINDVDTDTIAVPSAIGEVIAREAYRKNVRVVVEIGTEETPDGGLTTEQLRRELASAQFKAEEYRRENEAIVNNRERLRTDFATPHPVAFDPERHITKATVAAWLEEDAKACDRSVLSFRRTGNLDAAREIEINASDTRAIIARINTTKESP